MFNKGELSFIFCKQLCTLGIVTSCQEVARKACIVIHWNVTSNEIYKSSAFALFVVPVSDWIKENMNMSLGTEQSNQEWLCKNILPTKI